jgi:hypothetical protein
MSFVRPIRSCAVVALLVLGGCAQDPLTSPSRLPADAPRTAGPLGTSPAPGGDPFGPVTYVRSAGKPTLEASTFPADPGGRYVITIDRDPRPGANASITLNGQVLVAPGATDDTVTGPIQLPVSLAAQNTLAVRLTGRPGSTFTLTIKSLGWHLVSPGVAPVLRVFADAPELGAIFAAYLPDYEAGSLWRFDVATAQWTELQALNWPIGKYRKLVYDAPNHRLLTYWDGLGQVFAIPETGGSWAPLGSAGNSQEYYEAYAFLDPVTDRLAVFGGYGYGTFKNTFWEWDSGANAWVAMPQGAIRPDTRFGTEEVAIDPAAHRAILGQRHLGETAGAYDDLWSYDLISHTWTNLIPPYTGPGASGGSALAYVPTSHTLYRFGGTRGLYDFTPDSQFYFAKPDSTSVVWTAIPSVAPSPGPRVNSGFYYDAPRNRLLLIGGNDHTDVWAYDLP